MLNMHPTHSIKLRLDSMVDVLNNIFIVLSKLLLVVEVLTISFVVES